MNPELSFALLGALIAVAFVLLLAVIFGTVVASKLVAYVARFKGFQASRKDNALSFGGVIDETPPAPKPSRAWPRLVDELTLTDDKGHPIPAKELSN